MRAYHAHRRGFLLGTLSFLTTGFLVGCGGASTTPGPTSSVDPKGGTRRKEMADFIKNNPSGSSKK